MSVLDRVREQFPQYSYLLNNKEIGPLLRDAVDPDKGFSPARFQAEFMNTNWFKSKSVSGRQYSVLQNTEPGEFKQQIGNMAHAVRMEAKRLGIRISNNEVRWFAHSMLKNGWAPNDPRVSSAISRLRKGNLGRIQYGAIRSAADKARQKSHADYFLPLGNKDMWRWADNIARGMRTEDDYTTWLKNRAMKKYPHLKKQLNAGHTMSDMFNGHIQGIAEELELNPAEIQPWRSGSKWNRMLNAPDAKSGKIRAMTEAEVRTMARRDERFWGTQQGRQLDAGMTNFVLEQFGKRK